MQVKIKDFDVSPIEVRTNGIEFEIRTPNGDQQLGDLILTRTSTRMVSRQNPTRQWRSKDLATVHRVDERIASIIYQSLFCKSQATQHEIALELEIRARCVNRFTACLST